MKLKYIKACNRCMYTWEGEEVYCPMCGQLFTHAITKETMTKEEFEKKYKESEKE